MEIQKITFSMGNDFRADMICEHCGHVQKLTSGYHDGFYHNSVIPAMTCVECSKDRAGLIPKTKNDNGMRPV